MKNHYSILGVPPGADGRRIKRAYRALVRRHHPDVNRSPNAELEFRAVNEAYEVLSDPVRRELYDRELAAARIHRRSPAAPTPERQPSSAEPGEAARRVADPWNSPRPARVGSVLRGEGAVHFGCGALFGGSAMGLMALRNAESDPALILLQVLLGAAAVGTLAAVFKDSFWRWFGHWW